MRSEKTVDLSIDVENVSQSARLRLTGAVILILLLVPSAAFLWRNADLPQFGDIHDDSVYYVSAKSLASGSYRIESLPAQPFQTKYPPLYPLLLSIAWRVNPHFPENLPVAAWISWLALPAMLAFLTELYPTMGITGWRRWLLVSVLAINPYVMMFSATLLSELWFTAFLAAALLFTEWAAREEDSVHWAIAAGIAGGLAYLTRSAGIVLLASVPLYLWMRHARRSAAAFAAAMFPFVAGWMVWAKLHQLHTDDAPLVYYTDYFRYEVYNFSWKTLHLFLWKNVDGLVTSLGYLILPNVTTSLFMKMLGDLIGVAMISGILRMVRRGRAISYAMYSAGAAFLLVIWHFPPNERFVLPLVPLAFAGLLTEMEHFVGMVRLGLKHRDRSQRVASVGMLSFVTLAFIGAFALQGYVGGVFMNDTEQLHRQRNIDHRGAYAWIRENLPQNAALIAYNDPVLYLNTGRRAISRPLPPYIWYTEDHAAAVNLYSQLASYARVHGAEYVYYTTADLRRDMGDDDTTAIEDAIRSNPGLAIIYQHGIGTLYRVDEDDRRPNTAYTTAPAATITSPGQVVAGR